MFFRKRVVPQPQMIQGMAGLYGGALGGAHTSHLCMAFPLRRVPSTLVDPDSLALIGVRSSSLRRGGETLRAKHPRWESSVEATVPV